MTAIAWIILGIVIWIGIIALLCCAFRASARADNAIEEAAKKLERE